MSHIPRKGRQIRARVLISCEGFPHFLLGNLLILKPSCLHPSCLRPLLALRSVQTQAVGEPGGGRTGVGGESSACISKACELELMHLLAPRGSDTTASMTSIISYVTWWFLEGQCVSLHLQSLCLWLWHKHVCLRGLHYLHPLAGIMIRSRSTAQTLLDSVGVPRYRVFQRLTLNV